MGFPTAEHMCKERRGADPKYMRMGLENRGAEKIVGGLAETTDAC